ncbi:hypothetical protein CW304_24255 [Bacillus sp. UFRGS-B20]|nr:hypothetical protein CW304_24255 [Bacillus sp. UFRGS-B20]
MAILKITSRLGLLIDGFFNRTIGLPRHFCIAFAISTCVYIDFCFLNSFIFLLFFTPIGSTFKKVKDIFT